MNKPASADLSEVSPISCAPACDQTAEDAAFYRDVLHELIEFGMELVREVVTPLAAPEKAAVFDQVSRTVRRTVRLAQFLGEKARAAIGTCRAAGRSDKWAGGAADVPGGDPRRAAAETR